MTVLTSKVRQAARDAEEDFHGWAEDNGWEVFRSGWPDFLCIDAGWTAMSGVKRRG